MFMNKICSKLSLLALVIFLAMLSGGCGGSGGTVGSRNSSGDNTQFTILDDSVIDFDGDQVPDILDFNDIDQRYYGENDTLQGIQISSIPSRHYLKNFKGNASFSADLTAGTEYTIEISESAGISGITEVADYAYPIGNNIPYVEIINPQGNALSFLDFGTYDSRYDSSAAAIVLSDDQIELSVYPFDDPYMICYTFRPSVTGSYTINFTDTASNDVASADENNDYFEHVPTLFIYEELRSGTDRNEAGYYERYRFEDEDGNTSETISMTDIMALREAYNKVLYDTSSASWELDGALEDFTDNDDSYWKKASADMEAQVNAYLECLHSLKQYYGLFDSKDIEGEKQEFSYGGVVNEDDEDDEDEDTAVTTAVAPAKLNAGGTQIKQQLFGIPYKDDYQPGVGYFALTGVQARSNAVKSFTLNVPKRKNVKTNYSATFVSSQEDRENLSKTTTGASLSIGGFGLGASYSSESKFKFGLTSTTYVIHYEEVEDKYRALQDDKYKLKKAASRILKADITKFREKYGDYFVAGYKYGGTYDAFITITTKTIGQLDEVKKKLSAGFSTSSLAVKAEIGKTTKETLERNEATVSIQIKTAGIDVSHLKIPTTTNDISKVPETLNAFRQALQKTTTEGYQPVYVVMKRYSLLDDVDEQMDAQDDSGLVPVTPKHSTKILAVNREKLIMDSYYNVISDLTDSQIDSSVRNRYKKEYEEITSEIGTGGNDFYAESNAANMDKLKAKMENLSGRLKAVGDRYVFYQVLMSKQKQERNYSPNNITEKPFGKNGGHIGVTSFAVSTVVTSDIGAGKHDYGDKKNESPRFLGHIEWSPVYTAKTKDGGSEAVFCYIEITANNRYDLNRDVKNSPCIAKNRASFYFQSGGTRWGEWETKLWSMRFRRTDYPFGGLE